jgi:hypothetical protein
MFTGVGIIGALASLLSNLLVQPAAVDSTAGQETTTTPSPTVDAELAAIRTELAALREQLATTPQR